MPRPDFEMFEDFTNGRALPLGGYSNEAFGIGRFVGPGRRITFSLRTNVYERIRQFHRVGGKQKNRSLACVWGRMGLTACPRNRDLAPCRHAWFFCALAGFRSALALHVPLRLASPCPFQEACPVFVGSLPSVHRSSGRSAGRRSGHQDPRRHRNRVPSGAVFDPSRCWWFRR